MRSTSRIPGLYKLSPAERFSTVVAACDVPESDLEPLRSDDAGVIELADHMVENAIGVMPVPLGVAANFIIDGRQRLVPMATEEASVIAAASNAASIAREHGGFVTSTTAPRMIAQVQVLDVVDAQAGRLRLLESSEELLAAANEQDPILVGLGGGAREIEVRVLPGIEGPMLVLHLVVDVGDAMGANAVNTMAEAIAPRVGEIARGRPLLRILSNKADRRIARARATFDAERLGGRDVAADIVHASQLAAVDPYRAATHNKGIMNGVSAVVLATGNDTRAVEAGAHSHAASTGAYTTLSSFELDADGNLAGALELPLPVGLVGGATKVHPVAKAAIRLLEVDTARELAGVIAAVGLAQNLAAVRALATDGIQRGHMSLHARNIAVTVGAVGEEVSEVVKRLIAGGAVRQDRAESILAEVRDGALSDFNKRVGGVNEQ